MGRDAVQDRRHAEFAHAEMHVVARGRPALSDVESLRSVPFDGVRSAEPPSNSGSAGPSAFSAAWDDCRVASDLPSACACSMQALRPVRRSRSAGRPPCAARVRRPAREIRLCRPRNSRAIPARPARLFRACPMRRGYRRVSRTAASSSRDRTRAGGDLLVAHGLAVHGGGALLVRGAPADDGPGANQRRAVGDRRAPRRAPAAIASLSWPSTRGMTCQP